MAFWTRLRPGKQPRFNRAFCDFPRRARGLRLDREIAALLRVEVEVNPRMAERIARQAIQQIRREEPPLEEPPF